MGRSTTSIFAPSSSRIPASRSRFSSSSRWFTSPGSCSRHSTTVRGSTNRHTSSTCPCVSSPAIPLPSQSTLVTPRESRNSASRSARDSPGLRACTSRSSRHSSVVSSVPRPFTSMLPPSRTTSRPAHCALGDLIVFLPVGVFGPGIEAEPHDRDLRRGPDTSHEHGPEVARPPAVRRDPQELHASSVHAGPLQYAARLALVLSRLHEDPHRLAWGELAHDLPVHPLDRGELPRPVARVVRPADPGGRVRLPLGGHREAERGR